MKFLKIFAFSATFFLLLFIGCTGAEKTARDAEINEELKAVISKLDNKVIGSLLSNDRGLVEIFMTNEFKEASKGAIDTLYKDFQIAGIKPDHKVFTQYYIIKKETDSLKVTSKDAGVNTYSLSVYMPFKENFMSLLLVDNGKDYFLLINGYGKVDGEWKLNTMHFGEYTIGYKTAIEWYEKSLKEHNEGYLLDAVNSLLLSSRVAYPGGSIWEYSKAPEIKAFYTKTLQEANKTYKFPIVIDTLETEPRIINISLKRLDNEYYPVIKYYTSVDLNDSIKATNENTAMHNVMESICKGITKDSKYVYYIAINNKGSFKKKEFVKEPN
ncbi:hypothetical protein NBRC110019_16530 [Neptunitalea chrysea]|uniref:Uncharacterized protein n=1 Tax=Neptunitalea chrysea TaxID=1647581 RepID=A0A9W6EW93_9FLAO|nr:hypothetical protein [Neptunitalea chrysea]GLB52613.1 hypothetical protein NBRC110019_16530 [Neptunitalea chrysea]